MATGGFARFVAFWQLWRDRWPYTWAMSRIHLVDPDDPSADPKARALLLGLRDRYGADLNVLRALANHPDLMESFLHLGAQPAPRAHIRPDERELAYLTASVANDCHY